MGLFSRKYRVYTWTALLNFAVAAGFIAAAGVLWNWTNWTTHKGISDLAIGFLAVGLFAFVVGVIAAYFGGRARRSSQNIAAPVIQEETEEVPADQGEWVQMRVVEGAVEKWVDVQPEIKAGKFDYEINKMDKHTYYINFFNEKNVRVYQLLVVPARDKKSFDVSVSFARPDNKAPQFEIMDLEKAINEQKQIDLALAE